LGHGADLHGIEHDGLRFEVLVGQLETGIPQRELARAELLRLVEREDPLLAGLLSRRESLHGEVFVDRHVRVLARVDDLHRVGAVLVREEVPDPFFLEEPAHEVEIRFAVLDTVVPALERPLDLQGELDAVLAEDLLDDVGDGHVLEHAALGLPREEPELGNDLEQDVAEILVTAELRNAADDAVEPAFLLLDELDLHADALAEELVERHGPVAHGDGRRDLEPEKP
jgi:hypothetical protein